ncbi:MAG: fatty acid desaturase [Bacteriovoracaceae bacterium]|jgi:stearoyl-CoA desaturase (delta-9 desaturase)|nr:fatty acid desaturase [Bacteriovoracaceae bacterium]
MANTFKYHLKNISWLNALFLLLTPPASIVLTILWIYFDGFDYRILLLGIFFYILSGISITAGYHRLFSHRAYDAHPLVKVFFLIFGAAAFQNSVLKWAADHRIHHNQVDTHKDPYNIKEGFFYAHMGWILLKENNQFNERYVKDLMKDKWVRLQHNHYFKIAGFFGIILPTLIGWLIFDTFLGGIAVGALFKVVVLHHSTFFINSLCHYIGNTPYTDSNSAKDSWFMALLTFGEGYHNFHHFFQADYRNGVRWFQFDPTKWLIKFLAWLKLASKLKKTPDFKILAAKLQMKIKEAKQHCQLDDKKLEELEKIKENIIGHMRSIEELKKQYQEARVKLSGINLLELKRRLEIAKVELHYQLNTFNLMINV